MHVSHAARCAVSDSRLSCLLFVISRGLPRRTSAHKVLLGSPSNHEWTCPVRPHCSRSTRSRRQPHLYCTSSYQQIRRAVRAAEHAGYALNSVKIATICLNYSRCLWPFYTWTNPYQVEHNDTSKPFRCCLFRLPSLIMTAGLRLLHIVR